MYGRDPPPLISYEPGVAKVAAVECQLLDCDEFLVEVRERFLQAQDTMKQRYDGSHCDVEFLVGQWVWLRLQHRSTSSVAGSGHSKLSPRFYGLFKILERIGSIAYRIQLLPRAKIHDVFHVTLLKEYRRTTCISGAIASHTSW